MTALLLLSYSSSSCGRARAIIEIFSLTRPGMTEVKRLTAEIGVREASQRSQLQTAYLLCLRGKNRTFTHAGSSLEACTYVHTYMKGPHLHTIYSAVIVSHALLLTRVPQCNLLMSSFIINHIISQLPLSTTAATVIITQTRAH